MADRAPVGVAVAFVGSGVAMASWASRIPQVRDELALSPARLGLLLLAVAVGSLVALPTAGLVVRRFGAARTISVMSIVCMAGLALAGLGLRVGVGWVAAGLLVTGYGNGSWDVAMNVEAAEVERQARRSIMSRFHAGFSIGTVIGGLVGAAMNLLGVSATAHLVGVAVVVAGAVVPSTRWLTTLEHDRVGQAGDAPHASSKRHPLRAWTERRTILIGVLVLAMAFTEGTGNDWLSVAAIDGYGATPFVGSMAFVLFVSSMTTGRWFGPTIIDRFGRVVVLRVGALASMIGLLLVVAGLHLGVAMVGTVLWGLGASLGFPVGMSAAADDPAHAAARVSVVATIGYLAFLTGPAVIGLVGDRVGVLRAIRVTAILMVVAVLVAGAARPLVVETRERAAT